MADKPLIYWLNRFDWWQSENEFLSAWNDFAYSQNLNIYESPKYVELSKAFVAIAWFAPTGYITKILRLPNDIQSSAYFSTVWEIYIDSWSWPALVYTLTDADKFIVNAICFTSFLLVFTKTDIHKVVFTGSDFKTYASCTEALLSFTWDWQWFSTNESYDLPVYNLDDALLYFWAWRHLYSLEPTLVWVVTEKPAQKWCKIVWLSWLNSTLKVYINYLNVNSQLIFYAKTQSDIMHYKNRVFKAVTTDWQLDYVVCSDWLWLYNWVNWTKLFNYNFSDFGKTWSIYVPPQNIISIDPYFIYIAYNKNIIKRWKKYTNLSYWFSISSVEANNITAISDELTMSWTLYYASDDKKWYYQGTTYKTTWYMELVIYYWETMEKLKKIDRIFNAIEVLTWCSIDVYFSINWAAYWWTANFSIAPQTEKFKELFDNELWWLDYHWIKAKIVINWNWTISPKLYEFTTISQYEKNI